MDSKVFESLKRRKLSPEKYVYLSSLDIIDGTQKNGPWNLLKNDSSIYHSSPGTGKWIRFDFAISPLYIKGFVLQSSYNRDPLNWVLEGSNDTINYIVIYTNSGTPLCPELIENQGVRMCKDLTAKEYYISKPVIYTSYRIRNTGMSSGDSGYLILSAVDFIGHFTDFPRFTCFRFHNSNEYNMAHCIIYTLFVVSVKDRK